MPTILEKISMLKKSFYSKTGNIATKVYLNNSELKELNSFLKNSHDKNEAVRKKSKFSHLMPQMDDFHSVKFGSYVYGLHIIEGNRVSTMKVDNGRNK